jgi:hypothetical protein
LNCADRAANCRCVVCTHVFVFRRALARGATLADSAHAGKEADPEFDPGAAIRLLFSEGLVIGIRQFESEAEHV